MFTRKRGGNDAWRWWAFVIVLLLRVGGSDVIIDETTSEDVDVESTTPSGPKTAEELGVPRCDSDYDCVNGGLCRKDADEYGRCLCPSSCPQHIPVGCRNRSRHGRKPPCLLMGENYRSRFSFVDPVCHKDICVCPPMFDEVTTPKKFPVRTLPPRRCDRRELKVVGFIVPSASVYKGNDITMYCCINMDPTGVVDASGVVFIHNSSVQKDPTSHPFQQGYEMDKNFFTETPCWMLEVKNVQFSDSGSYMCLASHAHQSSQYPSVNFTMDFEVKSSKKVRNFVVSASSTSANVTWETEDDMLRIDLRLASHAVSRLRWNATNAKSPLSIPDLSPATSYTLHITVHGAEMIKMTEHFQTLEKAPSTPRSEEIRLVEDDEGVRYCEVDWRAPEQPNGRINAYYVRMEGKVRNAGADSLVPDDYPQTTDQRCANYDKSESPERSVNPIDFTSSYYICRFGPLKPNRNYSVTIWAANSAGRSQPLTFAEQCSTSYAEPDHVEPPQSLPPSNLTNFALRFGSPPEQTNGPISCYYVAIVPLLLNASVDRLPSPAAMPIENGTVVFRNNMKVLPPEQKSHFAYIAESYMGVLPSEALIGDGNTSSGVQPCKLQYLSRYGSEDIALRQGLIYTGFLIVRVDSGREDPIAQDRILNPKMRGKQGRTLRGLIVTGPSYAYSSYFKPVSLNGSQEDGSWTTVLLLLGLLIVFALVGAMSFAYFTLIRGKKLSGEHIPLKMSVYGPVKADELPGEYRDRHKDSDFLFVQEFEKLPCFQHDSSASTRKENAAKNRYNDIRAFDSTRVRLNKVDGDECSDYINANFVKGYDTEKTFIAAQGPLPGTVADFWRMCWEQDVALVVMVANILEKNRQQCAKYWPTPEDGRLQAGHLEVIPDEVEYYSDYAMRSFIVREIPGSRLSPINVVVNKGRSVSDLSSVDCSSEYANLPNGGMLQSLSNGGTELAANTRRIVQYHFTNWNDYKAPECSTGLLRFLHLLRSRDEFSCTPVVVHCSAGVGRTGTLIAIDSMMDMYAKEGSVDVFKFVSKMRSQRNLMVQSLEQYTFVYKALAEWHLFGQTDMEKDELVDHYNRLVGASAKSSRLSGSVLVGSGMEAEFKNLKEELEPRPFTKFADEASNIMKNRQPRAVPFDRNRVCLQPLIGYADSSYINASHVKGYFYPYILAQDPLCPSTAFDLWRMVSEQRVGTLVMLCSEELFESGEKYWPDDISTPKVLSRESQTVTVSLVQEEQSQSHLLREMQYYMKTDPTPRTVCQYCFHGWPSSSAVPSSSESLLCLLGKVLERQAKQSVHSDQGPIVLLCRNGSSEAAIYCAVSLLMERLKAEHRVDVFQTVRGIQAQRPETFTKIEEYAFCYQAVVDYLRSYNR